MTRRRARTWVAGTILAAIAAAATSACQSPADAVAIDDDDIGGVVTSAIGPEAGVWVVAETTDLPTTFTRIVVTDDRGRYLVPDLPEAAYTVWVRGYGLVDSPRQPAEPGMRLDLTAIVAPDSLAAAQYYPAGYWASLLQVPPADEFPGTGPQGNGIAPEMETQAHWLAWMKNGSCLTCHQLGNKATREISPELGVFPSSREAWMRRIQSGQAGGDMVREIGLFGPQRAVGMFADWTDRIAAGEVPPAPPRPQGVERNVVISQWHWADAKTYLHDQVSTDRRAPTLNAYGPIYGAAELSTESLPILDPVRHTTSRVEIAPRDAETPQAAGASYMPSPIWGDEQIWTSRSDVHNPMFDGEGRLWMTARIRPPANPEVCRAGSSHPSAKRFPIDSAVRQAAVYDPETQETTYVDTCFDTHHLMFGEDADDTLWFNGYGSAYLGWLNTKMFDATGDAMASQGWTALILDTNGNGTRDAYVEVGEPADATKDTRIADALYSVNPASDGSVWGSVLGFPGAIVRVVPGSDPTETALAERYELPWLDETMPIEGYSPRGMDVDRNGVAWVALGSGHMARFDRGACEVRNGPTATGQHCPEGWTFYTQPLPQFKDVQAAGSAEGSYFVWVDQFDTFGLSANTPIATGNQSDAFLALRDGEWVVLRVPYPMGFYTKWLDGRIDDAAAGWKGRGLWSTVGSRTPFHMETGKGTPPIAMQFQLRPDPLAK